MKSDLTFYQAFSSAMICNRCLSILNPETTFDMTCPRCNALLSDDDYVVSLNKAECYQKALEIQAKLKEKREMETEYNGNLQQTEEN